MSLCTLDIICDTVMGQHVGAQEDATSPYVRAVVEVSTDTCPVKSAMFYVISPGDRHRVQQSHVALALA